MKIIITLAAAVALSSCNTLIGVGRDTKQGYQWTKEKIQGSGGSGASEEYGAPVY